MPSVVTAAADFPYTFPITFGAVDKYIQVGDYEPVLPIEYRYTLPAYFMQEAPSAWLGFIEVLQGLDEYLMPIWPSEVTGGTAHTDPSVFMQEGPSTWLGFIETLQGLDEYLMPIWPPEVTGGTAHTDPSIFMQISTPTFLPDGTGAASPTSTQGIDSGQTSTEAV